MALSDLSRIDRDWLIPTAAWILFGSAIAAQTASPPPKQNDVTIRYRIDLARAERLVQYSAMRKYLASIGLSVNPDMDDDPQDVNETRLRGTIDSANVRKLFGDVHVKALLLQQQGYKVSEDPVASIKVQMELAAGLPLLRQRELADQVRAKLAELGFQEAIGYDHHGHTRLVGLVPAGELETLLKDLRWEPSGWFVANQPVAELLSPIKSVSPILITEVIPEPEGVAPAKNVAAPRRIRPDDPSSKISADLRELASREEAPARTRMEVLLAYVPQMEDRDWRNALLQISPMLAVEGRLGSIVTAAGSPKEAMRLAELPVVSGVRLPRLALSSLRPGSNSKENIRQALQAAGLDRLLARGSKKTGIRVAIIDGDFRGYETFKGKELPGNLRYLDLTAERNASLEPDPFSSDAGAIGSGTQAALVVALTARDADLTLIRVDPAAPHQLAAVVRLVNGENFISDSLHQRNEDLRADADALRSLRVELLKERNEVLADFSQTEKAIQRREAYFKKQAEWDEKQKALNAREQRYVDLLASEKELKFIEVVSCALNWDSGYPMAGESSLNRFLEEHPIRNALWFQSAGNTKGQVWTGLFHDDDENGVMEFAGSALAPGSPSGSKGLKKDRWTTELNFLAWQPLGKEITADLPAKARLRLSILWREAHDARLFEPWGDAYRRPLTDLHLVVLRQRDPSGTKLPNDDLEVTARSAGLPQRLENQPGSAVYEQTMEFTVETAGRYALRVEGRKPEGIVPADSVALPGVQQSWELQPRLVVEALDQTSRLNGRPVFLDYSTCRASLGTPADSTGLLTVGAADLLGRARPYSSRGQPYQRGLLMKPNVLAFDDFRLGLGTSPEIFGSELATPFAAGLTTSLLGSGMPAQQWKKMLMAKPGQLVIVP